jgi:hypothetical protein
VEHRWQRYTEASGRLVEAFFAREEPAADDVAVVQRTLDIYLGQMGLDVDARQDIIQETMLLVLSGVRRGIVDRDGNLAAYVRTVALNCFRDASRYRARRPTVHSDAVPEPASDGELARLIDALATAEDVGAAMNAAINDGEMDLANFISDWLTMAGRPGGKPTLREAAKALGTNHVRVERELERFAHYLRQARAGG